MTTITAKVIAASSNHGKQLFSLQLQYPRFIHSEFMTHRVFSRSASSSRAIPVKKMLAQVWNEPAEPIHWGANQPGMQANTQLTGWKLKVAKFLWRATAKAVCCFVYPMDKLGIHKQVGNRLLEPWQYIHVIVTATEWANFDELRMHKDAQPEMQALALAIFAARNTCRPVDRSNPTAERDAWHLPYITDGERADRNINLATLQAASAARCARVSYLTHDGVMPDIKKDLELFNRLVGSKPEHASPTEHPARAGIDFDRFFYNLNGWSSLRWARDHGGVVGDSD